MLVSPFKSNPRAAKGALIYAPFRIVGRVTCVLERRDIRTGRHYRCYHDTLSKIFGDGTVLSGQRIRLAADEWFTAAMVLEVFLAFLEGRQFPELVRWRDITDIFDNTESGVLADGYHVDDLASGR